MTPLRDTGKLKDQRRQCGYRDTPMPGFILVAGLPVGDGTLEVVLLIWAGCDTFTVAGRCVAISEIPPIHANSPQRPPHTSGRCCSMRTPHR